jgi:hypothetical protein
MQSYRAEGYGRMSLFRFLTHCIRFYNIQPAADLRVTFYCDNSSLLEAEEAFQTRDVDCSNWYFKPDHDVIMTLSEEREGLPFTLISRHVMSHQDDERAFANPAGPEQLNVLADHRASAALNKLRAAGNTTAFYPLPACRVYLGDGNGISLVVKSAHSEPHSLSTSFAFICNNATTSRTRPITTSAGLLMDQPVPDSLTTSEHSWSNFATTGYPSEYAKDDAAPRLTSASTATKSSCSPSVPLPGPRNVGSPVSDQTPRRPNRDKNCSRYTLHHHQGYRELVSDRRHERS